MKKTVVYGAVLAFVLSGMLGGCSKKEEPLGASGGKTMAPVAEQSNPVKEFIDRPIGKARATHSLGDERTEAVDQAVTSQGE